MGNFSQDSFAAKQTLITTEILEWMQTEENTGPDSFHAKFGKLFDRADFTPEEIRRLASLGMLTQMNEVLNKVKQMGGLLEMLNKLGNKGAE